MHSTYCLLPTVHCLLGSAREVLRRCMYLDAVSIVGRDLWFDFVGLEQHEAHA